MTSNWQSAGTSLVSSQSGSTEMCLSCNTRANLKYPLVSSSLSGFGSLWPCKKYAVKDFGSVTPTIFEVKNCSPLKVVRLASRPAKTPDRS